MKESKCMQGKKIQSIVIMHKFYIILYLFEG